MVLRTTHAKLRLPSTEASWTVAVAVDDVTLLSASEPESDENGNARPSVAVAAARDGCGWW